MTAKPKSMQWWQSALVIFVVVGLFAIMATRMIESALVSSATTDEAIHILSGYLALRNGDYRLNPEHPFLGKMIAASPHVFLKTPLPDLAEYSAVANDFAYDSWNETRDVADRWLYQSGLNPQQILWPSRLVAIITTLLAGLGLSFWVYRRLGAIGGLLFAGAYSLDPTIIAHGQLANTDVWAPIGFLFTILAFIEYAERPTWKHLVLLSFVFGAALDLKFSLIVLVPLLATLWIVVRWRFAKPIASYWIGAGSLILGWIVVTALVYTRDLTTIAHAVLVAPIMPPNTTWMHGLFSHYFVGLLVPAEFWKGLAMVIFSTENGRPAYLLGHIGEGWWYYFPVAFLVKESTAMVLAFLALMIVGLTRIRHWTMVGTILAISLTVYWVVAMKSNLTLGIRHLLPAIPITMLLLAGGVSVWWNAAKTQGKVLIAILLIFAGVFTTVSLNNSHPFYLPYFNELAGGTANGGRYLADSNIDWGQALPQLHDWLAANGVSGPILLEYQWTGPAAPNFYGITYDLLNAQNQHSARLIAVSRSGLASDPSYGYLRSKVPTALVGNSIAIFDQRIH